MLRFAFGPVASRMMRFPVRRPQFLLFTSPAIQSGRRFMQAWMLKDCEGGPRVDEFLYVAIFAPAFFQEVLFASRGWRSHGA